MPARSPHREEALARVRAGETQQSVAKILGVDQSTVSMWCTIAGIATPRRGKYPARPEVRAEALRRVVAGERRIDVARSLNVKPGLLTIWCQKAGIPGVFTSGHREEKQEYLPCVAGGSEGVCSEESK